MSGRFTLRLKRGRPPTRTDCEPIWGSGCCLLTTEDPSPIWSSWAVSRSIGWSAGSAVARKDMDEMAERKSTSWREPSAPSFSQGVGTTVPWSPPCSHPTPGADTIVPCHHRRRRSPGWLAFQCGTPREYIVGVRRGLPISSVNLLWLSTGTRSKQGRITCFP